MRQVSRPRSGGGPPLIPAFSTQGRYDPRTQVRAPSVFRSPGRDLLSCCPWVLSSPGRAPRQAAPLLGLRRYRRNRQRRRTFAGSRTERQRACVRAAAFFLPSAPSPFGLSCAVRRHRRRRRCRRPAAIRGRAAPQAGQGRQDDATTRRQDRPRPPSGRGGRFLVVPSARRPVVLARRRVLPSRGVRGVCEGIAAEPFWNHVSCSEIEGDQR